jgi:hypothetical protein
MAVRDYFAELYVAGKFADAGWNVYFPHRDIGFDFIVSKPDNRGSHILRPVQVKGKYATKAKRDWNYYGYIGRLSQIHPEMVLAIPFFSAGSSDAPICIAYMPLSRVSGDSRRRKCQSASYKSGRPEPRRDYKKFFDSKGLKLLESAPWKDSATGDDR